MQQTSGGRRDVDSPNPVRTRTATPALIPPWQIWSTEAGGQSSLSRPDSLDDSGRLAEALKAYADVEQTEGPGRLREEAFARKVGVLLKLGKSREALDQITQHLKAEGGGANDISPILAMLAAYSYLNIGDYDQTLAWMGVVLKKSDGRGIVNRRARTEVERVIRGIPEATFGSAYQLWRADSTIAPMFEREKVRRAQGGVVDKDIYAKWFRPSSYGTAAVVGSITESDLGTSGPGGPDQYNGVPSATRRLIGVLLPETGKYAEHAQNLRQGIELAWKDSGHSDDVQFTFLDTAGDPARAELEYDRLVHEFGAAFALGPLLVKDAEQISRKSEILHVPFLTFTKRPGITNLSQAGFRLGATADNQSAELVSYAQQQLKIKNFAILFPLDGGNGEEFAAAFRAAVAKNKGNLTVEASYTPGNSDSIQKALTSFQGKKIQAVFLPAPLEDATQLLMAVKTSTAKDALLLGPALWYDPIALRGFADQLEGAVFVTPFYPGSVKPNIAKFISHYKEVYGEAPEILAAQGYDATSLVLGALAASEGQDPETTQGTRNELRETLIKKLKAVDRVEGVTGLLTVQENREITRRMSVLRLHRGEVIEVMSGGNVSGFMPDEPQTEETARTN